jgi:hypothetical protein
VEAVFSNDWFNRSPTSPYDLFTFILISFQFNDSSN